MKKKVVALSIIASAFVIAGISGGAYASSSYGETEMAGASMMIEQYYYSQADKADYSDPEAIVPFTYSDTDYSSDDEQAEPSMTGTSVATTAQAASPAGQTVEQTPVVNAGVDTMAGASVVAEPAVATQTTDVAATDTEADAANVADAAAATDGAIDIAPTPEPVSEYADIGISIANEYVHIRRRPSTESKIRGKLYRGAAAKILKTVGDWVKIKSGSVEGYIKSEYLAIGFDAEDLVDKYGTKIATVMTETLYVREDKNTECAILTLVSEDEQLEVTKEYDDWCKVIVDEDTKGYVAKEFVDIDVQFKKAISIKEEKEMIRRQREREEAIRRQEEEQAAAARRAAYSQQTYSRSSGSSSSSYSRSSGSRSSGGGSSLMGSSSGGGKGSDAASYAQNFVGNPYSYGGTSLTNGTDCSGFVQSVYKKYGVSLPRTSSAQSGTGKKVDLDNLQKGDLVFYSSGGHVNHVAMYIGDGKVVHASNKREGIKTSKINYRTPTSARRVSK